jgi:hypothetical protein
MEIFGELLLHRPPVTALCNVSSAVTHSVADPVIVPAFGNGLTVTTFTATAVPHIFVTLYEMVTLPEETPVTKPPDTVALPLLAVHVPPVKVGVRESEPPPSQTEERPAILPATGRGLTVKA